MSFLISSQRGQERDALSEAYYLISDVLNWPVKPLKARVPGISLLRLVDEEANPLDIMDQIKGYIEEKGPLVACLRITPLSVIFKTDLSQIVEQTVSLAKKYIFPADSWKIHLRKRQTDLGTIQVIEAVAAEINWGIVNLTNPDLEIRIEIVRDLVGVTVLRPNQEIRMATFTSSL